LLFVVVTDKKRENDLCTYKKSGEFMISIRQFAQLGKIGNSIKVAAASTLAIGAAALAPAAPAGAVLLSTGQLAFSDGTSDFYAAGSPSSYTVNFNPGSLAFVNSATGAFSTSFTQFATAGVTPNSPATFNLVSGSTYSLGSALNFNFNNGINVSINSGSTFSRTMNDAVNGVGFSNQSVTGQVTNADGTVNLQALSFTFNDNPNPGGGGYSITLSPTSGTTAVPEPFTVIGSIVGGTAAFRMRKKLANLNKN
jgi:hypothetical protein